MRHLRMIAFLMIVGLMMVSCGNEQGSIDVSWQLLDNQYQGGSMHKSEVTFTNNSKYTLKNDNWECYFSWFRSVVDEQESTIIDGETINGDLSKIYPTELFEDLKPGESISFPLIGTH